MTPDEPILEVLRDADGNFYCLEISTLKVVYQTEMQADQHKLLIHSDGKDSPVIATVDLARAKEGFMVVEFANPPAKVEMHHVPHKLPWTHSNTYFTYEGKKYHWKSFAALLEDDTRTCVATFHTINLGGPRRKHGSLVLVHDSTQMRDMAAVTRLAGLARADEMNLEKYEASHKS